VCLVSPLTAWSEHLVGFPPTSQSLPCPTSRFPPLTPKYQSDFDPSTFMCPLLSSFSVLTVRDFTMVFDAYSQCEESLLTARVAMLAEEEVWN